MVGVGFGCWWWVWGLGGGGRGTCWFQESLLSRVTAKVLGCSLGGC